LAREFNDDTKHHGSLSDRIEFFERNNVHVPYVDLKVRDSELLPIAEIVIGPAIGNKDNAKASLKRLLVQYGYGEHDVKIRQSKVPFLP